MPIALIEINGRVGRFEVPEGASPEQATAMAEASLTGQVAADPAAQSRDSRIKNVGGTIERLQSGQIGPTQAGFQVLGQGLGVINDKIGEAIPQPVKDVTSNVLSAASRTPALYGASRLAGNAASMAIPAYQNYAENNPNAAANLSAAGNLASVASLIVPGPRVVNAATSAATVAPEVVGKSLIRGAEKLATPKMVAPNSEQLANLGVKAYEAARASGEVFDAKSVTNKFISALDSAKPKKIAGTVETDLSQALESGLGKYRDLANKPLSIDEIDIIDKDLSNLKDQAYNAGKNQLGSELSNIQNALRGSVADSPSGKTLAEARDFYRRKYQMEDVERIFRNAEGRPNEATIIQTGYRNLANQARKKGSGYTKQQIKLMDKAAKGGLSIDALKLMSSKLIPIVAGASGNAVGAGAAYMGNLAAGAGATALQTAKANKLAKSIVQGITVPGEPSMINRAAKGLLSRKQPDSVLSNIGRGEALPPGISGYLPAPTYIVNSSGQAATAADRAILGEGYKLRNPTMGELQQMAPDEANAWLNSMMNQRNLKR